MNMLQLAPPSPVTARWMLYVYDNIAYLTFSGRVVATASVATPAQDAHLERLFQRLATHTHTKESTVMTTITTYDASAQAFADEVAPLITAIARRYSTEEEFAAALSRFDLLTEHGAFVRDLWRIVRAGLITRGEIVPPADC